MNAALLEVGLAGAPAAGQLESGDCHVIIPLPSGVLVVVADGLGHGGEAAAAAKLACDTAGRHAEEPLISLVGRCHERLRGTRGAVMSLASINRLEGMMTWVGVGNVEGKLLRADPPTNPRVESLLIRGGVVGDQLPPLFPAVLPIEPNDILIFSTDGIGSGFVHEVSRRDSPQQIADQILVRHSKGTDDALVLVARYLGGVS